MEKQQIAEIIEFSSTYFTLPFLYAVKYYFYKSFLGFRSKAWKFVLSIVLFTVANLFILTTASEILKIIMDGSIWIIIICILCKGSFLIKFYAVIVENAILLLINITFLTFDFSILRITHKLNMSFNEHMIISFINNISRDIISFTILFVFLKKICNLLDLKERTVNLYQGLYLLIPCLSSYSLALVFYIIQSIKIDGRQYYLPFIFPKIYYVLPLLSFALIISIVITAYTFKKMIEGEQEKQKNVLMEQQLKHSKSIETLYNGIRGIMHDMNNHIACLRTLACVNNIEEIKNYLDNISQTINKLDLKIKTGNPISDAVINEKYNIAKKQEIEFVCDFMIPKETLLEPMDLCTILSNTLDNAIEACMRITDSNIFKIIWIKSYIKDMYMIIEVSNTTTNKLSYVKNKIISTKSDKLNHGMGISNIEAVVRKYNGIVDIVEEKNKFIINLMLKIE
jgi:hypothetical protein